MALNGLYGFVRPQIVPADRETWVEIRPPFQQLRLEEGATYQVLYFPTEHIALRSGWPGNKTRPVRAENGALRFPLYFEGEQEHVIQIKTDEPAPKTLGQYRLYSLRPDLFGRRPWKGDTHLHSTRSDGKESPAWVAGACRRIGLDFAAVTDHRHYGASLEAQAAYSGIPHDLRLYRGEEVHAPDNPVHLINFGGSAGVHDPSHTPEGRAGVERLQRELGALPPGVDPHAYASCVWCFDRIRDVGGLGIFCHPYWFPVEQYTPAEALTTHLFDTRPFDAYEVIGGYYLNQAESNILQVARYHEERAKGRALPIVGASDSHGCENGTLFGWYYTIAFAPTPELPDLIAAVKDLYSVAVEALPGPKEVAPRAHGPFRLVKYAQFLIRELFPAHDALCREEGRLMLAHAAGDPDAGAALARLNGRCAALYDALWEKPA